MNERIIELARKAGLKKPHGSDTEYIGDFDWREFTELIIEGCLTQVQGSHLAHGYDRDLTDFERGYRKGVETCLNNIQKEFGIKYSY